MLGSIVKVGVTRPCNSTDETTGIRYLINYGEASVPSRDGGSRCETLGAFILGVNYPVTSFEGKIIAVLRHRETGARLLVVAPKKMRRIEYEIADVLSFALSPSDYFFNCLYEHSCGAVVYRIVNGKIMFLLIKNRGATCWGFPKGHRERGETKNETARREVLEETGIRVNFIDGFCETSNYNIGRHVEKRVDIFLATTRDTKITIQREEIERYLWLDFDAAVKQLKFDNDKSMLGSVKSFMIEHGIWCEAK